MQGLKSANLATFQTGPEWPCPISAALKNPSLDFKNYFCFGFLRIPSNAGRQNQKGCCISAFKVQSGKILVCYSKIYFYPLCQENLKALGSLCNLGCRSWITRNSTHFCVQLFHHARVVVRKSSYNTSILVEQITEFYIVLGQFLIKPRYVFVQT